MMFSKYPSGGEMLKNSLISTALFLPTFSLPAMDIKACGDQVVLSGAVEVEDFDRISAFLSENPNLKTAVLRNSPGGDASSGYRTGALFREKGISTYVSGYCRSSCSRMFLGGAQRYFTTDFHAEQTTVAFHGNYKPNGALVEGAADRLKSFIAQYTDGKANDEFVSRWVVIPDRRGYAYFFHPDALKRSDNVSVLLCSGRERNESRWNACEKISPHNALNMGIVTSLELKQSCDMQVVREAK
jgi:hypothetical protein